MPSLASFAGRDKNAPMLTVHGSITKQSQPRVKIVGELCPTGFCLAKKKKKDSTYETENFSSHLRFPFKKQSFHIILQRPTSTPFPKEQMSPL